MKAQADTQRISYKAAISAVFAYALAMLVAYPAFAVVLSGHLEEVQDTSAKVESIKPIKPRNTFPLSFKGQWQVQTKVLNSQISSVQAGQVITSEVTFYPTADGRILAKWHQPGWVETQSSAMSFNGNAATADRTTYYFGDNAQGSWAARARDEFTQIENNSITAKSYVDQYIDGNYVGRYRTESVMTKIGDTNEIARR